MQPGHSLDDVTRHLQDFRLRQLRIVDQVVDITTRQILSHHREIRRLNASAHEQDNVGMSQMAKSELRYGK